MASGDKFLATQISTNTSSWYQRLRAIQKKTPTIAHGTTMIEQTSDPLINRGSLATVSSINNFINALNTLQDNVFLKNANWSSYKPSSVSQGSKISASITQTKINNMLTSLEGICVNYKTYGQYGNTCADYTKDTTNSNCSDLSNFNDDGYNPNCQTNGNYGQCATNSNYSDDSYCVYGPWLDDPDYPGTCTTHHELCPFYADYSNNHVNNTYSNQSDYTDESNDGRNTDNNNDGVDIIDNVDGADGQRSIDGNVDCSKTSSCGYNGDNGVDNENGTSDCSKNGADSVNGADYENGVQGDEWNFPDDWDGSSCTVESANPNCSPHHSVDGNDTNWANEGDYTNEGNDSNNNIYNVDTINSNESNYSNDTDENDNINNSIQETDGTYGQCNVDSNNTTNSVCSNYTTYTQTCGAYSNYSVLNDNIVDITNQEYSEHIYDTDDLTNGDCTNQSNNNIDSVNNVDSNDNVYNKCATNSVYSNYTDDTQNSKACSTYATYNVA